MSVHNYEKRYEDALKILNRKNIPEENRKQILKFLDNLFSEGISMGRIVKYVYNLITISEWLGKNFEDVNKDDIKELTAKIEKSDYSPWTKRDYRICIKKFYRWLRGLEEGDPEETRWIKTGLKNNYKKLPEDMLTEEEVKKLINTADHPRDKAIIAVLYESGCRIGEIADLKIKNVSFDDYGAKLLVNGKTGARRVRIVSSVPYLVEWMNKHPLNNDPEEFLWTNRKNHRRINYSVLQATLKRIRKRAGISKAVNPHNFRHSRATYLAQFLTEAQMKEYFGWTQSSKMASIYVHLSGRDVDKAILKVNGIKENEEEKEESKLIPKKCDRCKEINGSTDIFCKKCGFPLDEKSKRQIIERDLDQRKTSEILDKMLENEEFEKIFIEAAKRIIGK